MAPMAPQDPWVKPDYQENKVYKDHKDHRDPKEK